MIKLQAKARAAGILTAGNMSISLLSLARNVIIARQISVENFGIASTFLLATAVVELAGNMGLDRLMIQANDGNRARFQAVIQTLQLLRGILASAALYFLASPIASLFGVPQATWAYQLLAIVPFLRGLIHLDIARAQRHMLFAPSVYSEGFSVFLSTALALPLALWLEDYRVALWAIIIQACFHAIISHVLATRPYRMAWDASTVRRALYFGLPLFASGILLFGTQQGDRLIVGAALGMEDLGWFSAAFAIAAVPALVVSKIFLSFSLPLLSRTPQGTGRAGPLEATAAQVCLLVGVGYAVGLMFAGPSLLLLMFGDRYALGLEVLAMFAAARCFSIARTAPATVSMSRGDTTALMLTGVIRTFFLVMAFWLVHRGFGAYGVAVSGLAGEFTAYIAAILLLRLRLGIKVGHYVLPCLASICIVIASLRLTMDMAILGNKPWVEIPFALPAAIVACLLCSMPMPGLWRFIASHICSGRR